MKPGLASSHCLRAASATRQHSNSAPRRRDLCLDGSRLVTGAAGQVLFHGKSNPDAVGETFASLGLQSRPGESETDGAGAGDATNSRSEVANVDRHTAVDWRAVFFGKRLKGPERFHALAKRRYAGTPDAGAAYNFALEELSANNWRRLRRGYQGKGRPESFLTISFVHLLEEYRVRKYGRKRPPAWVSRQGGIWLRIYELSCLQRMPAETVADQLCARSQNSRDFVLQEIRRVRAGLPRSGEYTGEYTVPAASVGDEPAVGFDPVSETLEQADLRRVLQVMADSLEPDNAVGEAAATAQFERRGEDIDDLREALRLDPKDRLALRMVYQDGYSITSAARALRMHRKKFSRDLHRTVQRLKLALERLGYNAETLLRTQQD